MSRIRLALLAALVAAALTATAASSAQAHEWKSEGVAIKSGLHWNLFHRHFTLISFLGTPFGVSVHVLCLFEFLMGLLFPGKGLQVISGIHCTVTKPANCTVKEPIELKATSELVGPSPGVELELKPEGESFGTVTLEGASCALKGSPFAVTGTQTCKLPGVETEAVIHEMECLTTGSKLKAGGKAATLEAKMPELERETKEKWSAV